MACHSVKQTGAAQAQKLRSNPGLYRSQPILNARARHASGTRTRESPEGVSKTIEPATECLHAARGDSDQLRRLCKMPPIEAASVCLLISPARAVFQRESAYIWPDPRPILAQSDSQAVAPVRNQVECVEMRKLR